MATRICGAVRAFARVPAAFEAGRGAVLPRAFQVPGCTAQCQQRSSLARILQAHGHAAHPFTTQRSPPHRLHTGAPTNPRSTTAHASPASTSGAPDEGADSTPASGQGKTTMWTLPTILTVARLFAIPPVMWLFTFTTPSAAAWASGIFVVASLTDFLDGYIARKWNLSTPFGAFLDPVADKLMVCTVLIMLCTKTFDAGLFAAHPWLLHALASAVIARELAMSALREWAASLSAEARGLVAVNSIGKVKTTLQLVSLAMLLAAMNGGDGALVAACAEAGPWALLAAAGLTVYSFAVYFAALAKFMV